MTSKNIGWIQLTYPIELKNELIEIRNRLYEEYGFKSWEEVIYFALVDVNQRNKENAK